MAIFKYKNTDGNFEPIVNSGKSINIFQSLGSSTEDTISQKVITDELEKKQDTLVSGVNIVTINDESLLGPGNIIIEGGGEVDTREKLIVSISSNQSNTTDLNGVEVTVTDSSKGSIIDNQSWEGFNLVFLIDPGINYKVSVSDVNGYKKPGDQSYTSSENNVRSSSFVYEAEVVNVSLDSDDGKANLSNVSITITNNSNQETIATGYENLSNVKIPFGISYKISVSDLSGYLKPEDKTLTADQDNREITLIFEKLRSASIGISEDISDPKSMISVTDNDGILQILLPKFRRCLAKSTEDNKIKICYLNDSNSNQYHDGSSADLSGRDGDVMVYFPEFWYKGIWNNNRWNLEISLNKRDDYHHAPASLVGAYKAYKELSELFSRSGVKATYQESPTDLSEYARNRGKGFHIIDYQQHCIICWMFYAKYKNTDSQSICGTGYVANSVYSGALTGGTNSRGILDTVYSSSSNGQPINFLGIEDCWGGYLEFIEGIHSYDRVIYAYDKGEFFNKPSEEIISSTKRTINVSIPTSLRSYITKMYLGEFMDMVPDYSGSGTQSTYYCDCTGGSVMSSSTRGFFKRASDGSNIWGLGISCFYLTTGGASSTESSRLAFDGEITVIDSPTEFKAITQFR